jgi:anhydro-N-acetylmuramic acid kinase
MKKLISLNSKKKKFVIGLMTGTSVDSVDVSLIEIRGNWLDTKIKLVGFAEYSLPKGLKEIILKNSNSGTSDVSEISQLNFLLAQIYNDAINSLLEKIDFPKNKVDLIGSHGQTIHHLPEKVNLFGYNVSSTLQIGDPSVLAKLSGIITIGDFRVGDVALGGQGAPLIPYFDFLLFHSANKNRALLNIGGISNFTILKKNCRQNEVLAFDTGPGNMLIDSLMKYFFKKEFDYNGETASSGKINKALFNTLISKDNFIEKNPPKSTGRELYGFSFIADLIKEFKKVKPEDWINTVSKFTAYAIYRNYEKFIKKNIRLDELIISGGGAKNNFIYNCLSEYFGEQVEVKIIDEIGISADAKESICFAVLANETVHGNPTNIPLTTGADKPTVLGKICLP